MSCHSLLACKFLLKDQLLTLWGFPCVLFVVFPLLLLIFFLCILFLIVWLICVLAWFSLDLSCMGLSVLPGLNYFFSHIREVFNYKLFKYFLSPFLFSLLLLGPLIQMVVHLTLSQRSLKLSSVLFIPFSLFCSAVVISTLLSSLALALRGSGLTPGRSTNTPLSTTWLRRKRRRKERKKERKKLSY